MQMPIDANFNSARFGVQLTEAWVSQHISAESAYRYRAMGHAEATHGACRSP